MVWWLASISSAWQDGTGRPERSLGFLQRFDENFYASAGEERATQYQFLPVHRN